ncbi:hypothetical protein D9756_007106 [Leucocoprinus leucothites]|uniref:G domain-containing protein n=1 Tax=Leucocoprinus leucothites TaxID=201217 RepID=A0A8H5FY89_9AGAR|nr:hypothetical protein D9756_007106 [Leucoagaricus leucothites]
MCLKRFLSRLLPSSSKYSTYQKVVAVIGCTGAGISTFIHSLLGPDQEAESGPTSWSLTPDTKEITPCEVILPSGSANTPILVLDTPGIDFEKRTIKSELKELQGWKKKYYRKGELAGIIFINDPCSLLINGKTFSIENSGALRDLCGEDWAKKTVLVNNPHERDVQPNYKGFTTAENFWSNISAKLGSDGPGIRRFNYYGDRQASARGILGSLVGRYKVLLTASND